MKRSIVCTTLGAIIAALFAGCEMAWAFSPLMPASLYKPELKRELTQQERVTYQNVPAINFPGTCYGARNGTIFGWGGKEYVIPDHLKPLVRKWCEPGPEQAKVTAQSCADLERQYEKN